MAHNVQAAGVLLIDGHTRVDHGSLTKLPRRYVSRERLCLRGTTDYWDNALDGQPFFCVTQPIDPGLIKTLETEIIPRLLEDIPGQPAAEAITADPHLHRFTLIFDREGYSPDLFARLKTKRIAILTYHKRAGPEWEKAEFTPRQITLVHLARETLRRHDDARSFIRGLLQTPIQLCPDLPAGELRIELHGQANPIHDTVVAKLCEELNTTETHYPGTQLRLKYVPLRSSDFPRGQDV